MPICSPSSPPSQCRARRAVPCGPGGFHCTLTLPLEGAGDAVRFFWGSQKKAPKMEGWSPEIGFRDYPPPPLKRSFAATGRGGGRDLGFMGLPKLNPGAGGTPDQAEVGNILRRERATQGIPPTSPFPLTTTPRSHGTLGAAVCMGLGPSKKVAETVCAGALPPPVFL